MSSFLSIADINPFSLLELDGNSGHNHSVIAQDSEYLPPWTKGLFEEDEQTLSKLNDFNYDYHEPMQHILNSTVYSGSVCSSSSEETQQDGNISPNYVFSNELSNGFAAESEMYKESSFSSIDEHENDGNLCGDISPLAGTEIKIATSTSHLKPTIKKSSESLSTTPKSFKSKVRKPASHDQRLAHNRIERKYRMNINSKIANLQQLVPWMSETGIAFPVSSKTEKELSDARNTGKKLNKSTILDMVTSYISHIQNENDKKDMEIQHLKNELHKF